MPLTLATKESAPPAALGSLLHRRQAKHVHAARLSFTHSFQGAVAKQKEELPPLQTLFILPASPALGVLIRYLPVPGGSQRPGQVGPASQDLPEEVVCR
jgi:hypothetical protein